MSLIKPDVPLDTRPTWYKVAYYATLVLVGLAAAILVATAVMTAVYYWGLP